MGKILLIENIQQPKYLCKSGASLIASANATDYIRQAGQDASANATDFIHHANRTKSRPCCNKICFLKLEHDAKAANS